MINFFLNNIRQKVFVYNLGLSYGVLQNTLDINLYIFTKNVGKIIRNKIRQQIEIANLSIYASRADKKLKYFFFYLVWELFIGFHRFSTIHF